jgi:O-antigen ligase
MIGTRGSLTGIRIDRASGWSLVLLLGGAAAVFVAVQKPLLVIAGIFGAGFLVLALAFPLVALGFFVTLNFLEEILLNVSGGTLDPAIKGTGACLVLACIFRVISGRDPLRLSPSVRLFGFASAALVIWAVAASVWAADPHPAISGAARLAQGPLLALVMVVLMRTPSSIERLCYVYIGGAAVSALAGLSGVASVGEADTGGRLSGGVGDPNFFAAVMMPAVLLGLFMALAPAQSWLRRTALLGGSLVCLVAVFLSGSRGGVVALAVAAVAAVAFAGQWRAYVLSVALLVGAFCAFALALFAPTDTLTRITHLSAGGGTGRTDLWSVASDVYRKHPFGGIGLDNFAVVSPIYTVDTNTDLPRVDVVVTQHAPVHNTYLQVAAELGSIGIALLLGIVLLVLNTTRKGVAAAAARGTPTLELAGRGLFVGGLAMLIAYIFLTGVYEKRLWIVLGLLLAYSQVARRASTPDAETA